jgi:hypothetical protein
LRVPFKSDLQVRLGWMPSWLNELQEKKSQCWYVSSGQNHCGEPLFKVWQLLTGSYFRLRYSDGTEFLIDRQGTRIWATWPDRLTLEDLATYLLNPALGFVLRLRGVTCLHASAIAIDGQAIAIAGPSGAGKSTTAAAFVALGYRGLADDVVALSRTAHHLLAQPGYPQVRLWPESVKMLFGAADVLPRLTPTWDKRYINLADGACRFERRALPLAAIYILDERVDDTNAPVIRTMSARAALITLTANTYLNCLLDQRMRAQEFAVLAQLITDVAVRQVIPHQNSVQVSKLCHAILDDFRDLSSIAADNRRNVQYL